MTFAGLLDLFFVAMQVLLFFFVPWFVKIPSNILNIGKGFLTLVHPGKPSCIFDSIH